MSPLGKTHDVLTIVKLVADAAVGLYDLIAARVKAREAKRKQAGEDARRARDEAIFKKLRDTRVERGKLSE